MNMQVISGSALQVMISVEAENHQNCDKFRNCKIVVSESNNTECNWHVEFDSANNSQCECDQEMFLYVQILQNIFYVVEPLTTYELVHLCASQSSSLSTQSASD